MRPHDRQSQDSQQHDYDAESLVILIASAWQCAINLRNCNAKLGDVVKASQTVVCNDLDSFER